MSMQADKIVAVRTTRTVYRDADTVIKLFDRDCAKADVLSEALNQARMEQTQLHIPAVLEVLSENGRWGIRAAYINGVTLEQIMEENPARRRALLETFVRVQMQMHAQRCPQLPALKEIIARRLERAELPKHILDVLHARLAELPAGDAVCHGDFNPSNVLEADDGVHWVLDWPDAARGDAAADAAQTYLLFSLDEKQLMAEEYLALYTRETGVPVRAIVSWIPVAAAAQTAQSRPSQRKLLLKWVEEYLKEEIKK